MRFPRFLWWSGFHFASLACGLLLAGFLTALGILIDSMIRRAMGYQLFEGSVGFGTLAALLIFSVASVLLAFKTTTGAAPPGEWRPREHLIGMRPRLVTLLICLIVGSAASGVSTKELQDGVTYMTGAVLAVVPIHWLIDSIILIRTSGTATARRPIQILLAHLLQGLLRFLLVLAAGIAVWLALN